MAHYNFLFNCSYEKLDDYKLFKIVHGDMKNRKQKNQIGNYIKIKKLAVNYYKDSIHFGKCLT